jgi:D-serine deaminase-like pyridoxal phosphate-dependent protein
MMVRVAWEMGQAGISLASVSTGSTPTALFSAVDGVTEVRPGTYIFNDMMQVAWGSASPEQIALTVLTSVISRPDESHATVDAGSKFFCGDIFPADLGIPGYGSMVDRPECYVGRMNEEHGVVRLGGGSDPVVGEAVMFVPNHVCTSVNLSDELIGFRRGIVESIWPVAARGKRE